MKDDPLRVRVVRTLENYPQGLSAQELSRHVGVPQYTVSPMVSKMHCYGGVVEKVTELVADESGIARRRFKWRLRS